MGKDKKPKLKPTYRDEDVLWDSLKAEGTKQVKPIEGGVVKQCIARLVENERYLKYLLGPRGLTKATLRKFKIGCDNKRITIPVFAEDGKTLLNIRRYLPPPRRGRTKKMLPHRRTACPTSLFPLDLVDWNKPIILCEGEFDCMLLYQNGFNALTVTGSVKAWNDVWYQKFAGKAVIIIYDVHDGDDVGQIYANKRAAGLTGIAKSIKIVRLPLPAEDYPSGDITDYFSKFGGEGTELRSLIRTTKKAVVEFDEAEGRLASEITLTEPSWLYHQYFPANALCWIAGYPESGKTKCAVHVVSRFSCGLPIFGGIQLGEAGRDKFDGVHGVRAIWWNSENPEASSLGPALKAAGAAMSRIKIMSGSVINVSKGKKEWLDLTRHLSIIERQLQQHPACGLMVLDAFNAFLGHVNNINDPSIRQALDPLGKLLENYGVLGLGIIHFNKRDDVKHFMSMTSGSGAYMACCRAAFYVGDDPEDTEAEKRMTGNRRVITCAKQNEFSRFDVPATYFRIKSAGESGVGVLQVEDQPCEITAEQLVAGKSLKREECAKLLRELLKGGPIHSTVVWTAVMAASFSKDTFERAKIAEGISSFKVGKPPKCIWYMRTKGDKRDPVK